MTSPSTPAGSSSSSASSSPPTTPPMRRRPPSPKSPPPAPSKRNNRFPPPPRPEEIAKMEYWTPAVESVAENNVLACSRRLDVQRRIDELRNELEAMDSERRFKGPAALAALKYDAKRAWNEFPDTDEVRWRKPNVLAALETRPGRLPRILREGPNWDDDVAVGGGYHCSNTIPRRIRFDRDVFLARLKRRDDFLRRYRGPPKCACFGGEEDDDNDEDSDDSDSDDDGGSWGEAYVLPRFFGRDGSSSDDSSSSSSSDDSSSSSSSDDSSSSSSSSSGDPFASDSSSSGSDDDIHLFGLGGDDSSASSDDDDDDDSAVEPLMRFAGIPNNNNNGGRRRGRRGGGGGRGRRGGRVNGDRDRRPPATRCCCCPGDPCELAPALFVPHSLRRDREVMVEVVKIYPEILLRRDDGGGRGGAVRMAGNGNDKDELAPIVCPAFLRDKVVFGAFLDSLDDRCRPGAKKEEDEELYVTHYCREFGTKRKVKIPSLRDEGTLLRMIMEFDEVAIRSNPKLMLEALRRSCGIRGCGGSDGCPESLGDEQGDQKHLLQQRPSPVLLPATYISKTLRNNKNFCLRAAETAMAMTVPLSSDFPLKLRHLSQRLRCDVDVVKAFCRVDGSNLLHASLPLRRHCGVVKVACRQNARAILYALPKARTALFRSKAFCTRLFAPANDTGGNKVGRNTSFASSDADSTFLKIWEKLPQKMRLDVDVAVAASLASGAILKKVAPMWRDDVEYWRRVLLAPSSSSSSTSSPACSDSPSRCRPEGWLLLPIKGAMRSDPDFALSVARCVHSECDHSETLTAIVRDFPFVLEDREVLRNMGRAGMFHERLGMLSLIFSGQAQVGPLLDRDFAIEMCRIDYGVYMHLPHNLQRDRDVVRAALMGGVGRIDDTPPASILGYLLEDVQLSYPDLVAEAIRTTELPAIGDSYNAICPELWHDREVAMAWVSKKGGFLPDHFYGVFDKDEEMFLACAEHDSDDLEWADESLFANKDFMVKLVAVCPYHIFRADTVLEGDFDLMLAAFSSTGGDGGFVQAYSVRHRHHGDTGSFKVFAEFCQQLRERLALHKSFITVLAGIASTPAAAVRGGRQDQPQCCLPLLNQGTETSRGYMSRIVQYIGVDRGEKLQQLRRASLNLARWGY